MENASRPAIEGGDGVVEEQEVLRLESFNALYRSTFANVYTYLFNRCGRVQSVAEDLTQETFLAAVATIKEGRGRDLSPPWLMTVARNKLVDHYRQREREERRLSLMVGDRSISKPSEASDQRPGERALETLASVPASQRTALVLRYLDDLPVLEVAAIIGKSIHATESLLARGRNNFRRRYVEAEHD